MQKTNIFFNLKKTFQSKSIFVKGLIITQSFQGYECWKWSRGANAWCVNVAQSILLYYILLIIIIFFLTKHTLYPNHWQALLVNFIGRKTSKKFLWRLRRAKHFLKPKTQQQPAKTKERYCNSETAKSNTWQQIWKHSRQQNQQNQITTAKPKVQFNSKTNMTIKKTKGKKAKPEEKKRKREKKTQGRRHNWKKKQKTQPQNQTQQKKTEQKTVIQNW